MVQKPEDSIGIPWRFAIINEEAEEVEDLMESLKEDKISQEELASTPEVKIPIISITAVDSGYFSDGAESCRGEATATFDITLTEAGDHTSINGDLESELRESIGLLLRSQNHDEELTTFRSKSVEPGECWLKESRTMCCLNWATSLGVQGWNNSAEEAALGVRDREAGPLMPLPKALAQSLPSWLNEI